MATTTIKNAAGRISTIHLQGEQLIGVSTLETGLTLGRASIVTGNRLPNGSLPVTVTLPEGLDPATHGVMLWAPFTRRFVSLNAGANHIFPADLGYDSDATAILTLYRTWGPSGALSEYAPRFLIWSEAPPDPVTRRAVSVQTAATLVSDGIVGSSFTYDAAEFLGDVFQQTHILQSRATATGAWATHGDGTVPSTMPDVAGTRFRVQSGAFGPSAANLAEDAWVYSYTPEILALPVPAAKTLVKDTDFEVLDAVYRPTSQTTDFTPRFEMPFLDDVEGEVNIRFTASDPATANPTYNRVLQVGTTGVYQLYDVNHPVTPAPGVVDAALFQRGSARLSRLRISWQVDGGPWSADSAVFTVPTPGDAVDPNRAIFAPVQARVAESVAQGYQDYAVTLNDANSVGDGEGNPKGNSWYKGQTFHPLLALFSDPVANNWSMASGGGRGTKAITEHVVDQLIRWAADDGVNAPICRGGYHCQHEQKFVTSVALARIVPTVWNHSRLLAKYKTRLTLMMQACLVAYCFTNSDVNPFPAGFGAGKQRTLRGFTADRRSNPNFSSPALLAPYVIAAFLERDGLNVQTWMNDWTRDAFHTALVAAWPSGTTPEVIDTFAQDWTVAFQQSRYTSAVLSVGRGPTAAEIKASLLNYRAFDRGLADYKAAFVRELAERTFVHRVVPGFQNKRWPDTATGALVGEEAPSGSGWAERYGIKYGAQTWQQLRGCLGRAATFGQFTGETQKTAWANLPNKGEFGMHFEFDTTNGPTPNYRSSASYAMGGMQATLQLFTCMILYGKFSATDTAWSDIKNRYRVGIRDFNFRAKYGHRSYANGGVKNGRMASGSEDFGPGWLTDNAAAWAAQMDMYNMIARWWGFTNFPTDD